MKLDIDAITVNHNRAEKTILTINSLKENNELNSIILVDNGSDDTAYLDDLEVDKVIKNSINIGQAAALNQGFVYAKSKYILAMHNDIVINEPDWVGKAIDFLDNNEKAGFICLVGWRRNETKISSLESVVKSYPEAAKLFDSEGDFVEVTGTDSFMNIYRNLGIKANICFNLAGVSFFLNYLSLGYKLYVMRVSNGTHLLGGDMIITDRDGKYTEEYIKHRENVRNVHRKMLKKLGLKGEQ